MNALHSFIKFYRIIYLLSTLTICFAFNASAQKDYIITLKEDTLRGKIKNFSSNTVKFIQTDSSAKLKYDPNQIRSFYYDKTKSAYRSMNIPNEKSRFFLEIIEKGKITIYELIKGSVGGTQYGGSGSASRQWYAVKGSDSPIEIKSTALLGGSRKERKEAFLKLIEDDPALTKQFLEVNEFSFDFLLSIVKRYNSK